VSRAASRWLQLTSRSGQVPESSTAGGEEGCWGDQPARGRRTAAPRPAGGPHQRRETWPRPGGTSPNRTRRPRSPGRTREPGPTSKVRQRPPQPSAVRTKRPDRRPPRTSARRNPVSRTQGRAGRSNRMPIRGQRGADLVSHGPGLRVAARVRRPAGHDGRPRTMMLNPRPPSWRQASASK